VRTVVGCIIGIFIVAIPFIAIINIGSAFRLNSDIIQLLMEIWIFAAIPVYGAFVGYLQWDDRLIVYLPRSRWIISSALSIIAAIISCSLIIEFGPALLTGSTTVNQQILRENRDTLVTTWWITLFMWSVIIGTSSATPSWFIFKRNGYKARGMIIASIIGFYLMFLLGVLAGSIFNYYTGFLSVFFCSAPFILSTSTAFALKKLLVSK
jgi:hypothetical protein